MDSIHNSEGAITIFLDINEFVGKNTLSSHTSLDNIHSILSWGSPHKRFILGHVNIGKRNGYNILKYSLWEVCVKQSFVDLQGI